VLGIMRAQRAVAFYVLLGFVGGFLVLPCLHNLAHRADHEHGADGFSIRWHEDAHRRAKPHHHEPAPTDAPALRGADLDLGHGRGSAGHFGLASLAAPHFIHVAPPARLPERPCPPVCTDAPVAFSFAAAQPRGPPSGRSAHT
jgi:hypothetical protein